MRKRRRFPPRSLAFLCHIFSFCFLLLASSRPRVYDLFAECGRNDINLTVATINRTSRRLTSLNNSKQKFISNLHHVYYTYGRTHFLPLCLTLLEIEINIFQLIYLQKEKVSRRMKQLNVYLLTNSELQQTTTTMSKNNTIRKNLEMWNIEGFLGKLWERNPYILSCLSEMQLYNVLCFSEKLRMTKKTITNTGNL